MAEPKRTAIVLFNLGGPDTLEAVQPFLFNLFNDGAIIALPTLIRWAVAKMISRRRAPVAREIYRKMGGGSPLLPNTEAQAQALEAALRDFGSVKAFIAMRYWAPFSDEAAAAVKSWHAERIVLLPLYPQFSTTTTASSWTAWRRAAARVKLQVPTTLVCCYPRQAGFVGAVAELVSAGLEQAEQIGKTRARPRVLFSAHGLPQTVVAGGDPYQWQVEQTCAAVIEALGDRVLDWHVCYQSRVGPLQWIGPSTEKEIERAARERVPVVVVPIAFVSEHSETLVELDIEYEGLARRVGVPGYIRVPTVSISPHFIGGLATLVRAALKSGGGICPDGGARLCPATWGKCPMATGGPQP